jgi:DNA-binding XRE family transcriptional regulator
MLAPQFSLRWIMAATAVCGFLSLIGAAALRDTPGARAVKLERTPEERARTDAVRERFQRERPSLEDAIASGEFEPPISQSECWDMVEMVVTLWRARETAGFESSTVANRMGIDKDSLARLEVGKGDPTINLLRRYAVAEGKQIVLALSDLPPVSNPNSVPSP